MAELPIIESPFIQNNNGTLIKVHFETVAKQVLMKSVENTDSNVQLEIEALRNRMDTLLSAANAMTFKGVLDKTHPLPTTGYAIGETWHVKEAGMYAGQVCEIGDLVVCVKSFNADDGFANTDFIVSQTNIDGAVVGPTNSVDGQIALFDGTTGKLLKAANVTIQQLESSLGKKVSMVMDAKPDAVPADLAEGGFILVGHPVTA